MKTFVSEGKIIDYVAGADLSSGDVVVLAGGGIGVCVTDIANGATGSVRVMGVVELPKANPLVIPKQAKVYWDAGDTEINLSKSGNTLCGIAAKAAAETADTVHVLLLPMGAGQADAVADLDQTISGTYDQAEVQAISDKVDALLAALRAASLVASS